MSRNHGLYFGRVRKNNFHGNTVALPHGFHHLMSLFRQPPCIDGEDTNLRIIRVAMSITTMPSF